MLLTTLQGPWQITSTVQRGQQRLCLNNVPSDHLKHFFSRSCLPNCGDEISSGQSRPRSNWQLCTIQSCIRHFQKWHSERNLQSFWVQRRWRFGDCHNFRFSSRFAQENSPGSCPIFVSYRWRIAHTYITVMHTYPIIFLYEACSSLLSAIWCHPWKLHGGSAFYFPSPPPLNIIFWRQHQDAAYCCSVKSSWCASFCRWYTVYTIVYASRFRESLHILWMRLIRLLYFVAEEGQTKEGQTKDSANVDNVFA